MYSREIETEVGQFLQIILGINLLQHASHLSKTLSATFRCRVAKACKLIPHLLIVGITVELEVVHWRGNL